MSDERSDLTPLIALFLPVDEDSIESAFETNEAINVLAASLGCFAAAAIFILATLTATEREDFCRRLASMSDGQVQPWMAEAALRSLEGYPDALAGTDPAVMSRIHMDGLYLISSDYLTIQECAALRPQALQKAWAYQPQLAMLAQ